MTEQEKIKAVQNKFMEDMMAILNKSDEVEEIKERLIPEGKNHNNDDILKLAKYVTHETSPAFMLNRGYGFYANKGFFLRELGGGEDEWVIVKDELGVQVLVPKALARPEDIVP